MLTPRRWSNLLFIAIVLGIGAGGVIALVVSRTFAPEDHIERMVDPANAPAPVLPPAE